MAKIRLEYEYLEIHIIPIKWIGATIIESKTEGWWCKDSEVVDESILKNRIQELSVITAYDGSKKYRNIRVAS